MKSPSIRRALLVRTGIGVSGLLCLLSACIYLTVRHGLYRELDQSLEQTASLLSNQVELEKDHITLEWQEGLGTNQAIVDDGLFQFWNETTGETTRSPRLRTRDLPKFCGVGGTPLIKDIQMPGRKRHARAIGMRIHPFVIPEEMTRMKESGRVINPKNLPFILVVARDAKPVHRVLTRMRWILGTGTLLTLGIGFALINRAVRVSLRPINQLTSQVRDRAGHQLDSALELPGGLPAELTGLARNFDSLLTRVAATRQRERDFIRHAAHELRTPIAGLLATTELALSKPRDATEYAAHLEACQKTAGELCDLVKRLTALARIDQSPLSAELQAIDLEKLIGESLQRFQPVFEKRDMKVSHVPASPPPHAIGDRTLVRIILDNLLDNAASHATTGGEIAIQCRQDAGRVEVSISNPAENLPEDLNRLFEPLFRQESSSHNTESHLGIGLTLSQDAATAMGGSLQARNTDLGRIEFILSLPDSPP